MILKKNYHTETPIHGLVDCGLFVEELPQKGLFMVQWKCDRLEFRGLKFNSDDGKQAQVKISICPQTVFFARDSAASTGSLKDIFRDSLDSSSSIFGDINFLR
ncbi:hypothetical protein CEXT_620401 [Caerostris extrusa]|uniref:Uncharacterized protein n=1 Tax=Caerostris extrusa TaxID=172846 RepID=A0AAV4P086_CAEEX|nr:hypothetical protein CEXT_620401 [Caerostris extrusa]